MSKAIVVHETGGPDVLKFEDRDPGTAGPGEVLIEHTAIGLNFIDVYFRTGLYPSGGDGPFVPGGEAAGKVLDVGPGVDDLKKGDRVAYVTRLGACERRVIGAGFW